MKKTVITIINVVFVGLMASCGSPDRQAAAEPPLKAAPAEEALSRSVVYLEISVSPYDTLQPWKRAQSVKMAAYGTAVGPDLVITTAEAVADSSMIQARKYGENGYLNAERVVVDYDLNLCLIRINDEDGGALEPVEFKEGFTKNADLTCRWLSSAGQVMDGRGYLDRAQMLPGATTFQKTLCLLVSNTSRNTARGELYAMGQKPIGIACWSGDKEVGIIPAETINRFLEAAEAETYAGFGTQGFETYELLDPVVRKYMKMPEDMDGGVFVSHVYSRGTGSDVLRRGDALLAIDGEPLNAYGRFMHPDYDRLTLEYLIQRHPAGEEVTFEVWRDGHRQELKSICERFEAAEMLVPYHEFDRQPEYVVAGGYVFQKLTRPYMQLWGDNWAGKVPPHLFHYYRDLSLMPSEERREIVLLSFVLPAPINQGYQKLGRLIVSKCNGLEIKDMESFLEAMGRPVDGRFCVVEFEMDTPKVIIPVENLGPMDRQINGLYGITEAVHID